jgi:hypothetical protein
LKAGCNRVEAPDRWVYAGSRSGWVARLAKAAVLLAVVAEGFLDALGIGGSDALVDRQCLP